MKFTMMHCWQETESVITLVDQGEFKGEREENIGSHK